MKGRSMSFLKKNKGKMKIRKTVVPEINNKHKK